MPQETTVTDGKISLYVYFKDLKYFSEAKTMFFDKEEDAYKELYYLIMLNDTVRICTDNKDLLFPSKRISETYKEYIEKIYKMCFFNIFDYDINVV
jgi:hypothetical protein